MNINTLGGNTNCRCVMTYHCLCCGVAERTGGCVKGSFPCDCPQAWPLNRYCPTCRKCPVHCKCEKIEEVEEYVKKLEALADNPPKGLPLEACTAVDEACRAILKASRKKV